MLSRDSDFGQAALLAGVFWRLGYFVEIKVPIYVPSYVEAYQRISASDIDVLAIRFHPTFRPELAVAECKSGETGALEELLKVEGARQFLSAKEAYFLKTRVHQNAREVARRLGITPFDTSGLEVFAKSIGLNLDVVVPAVSAFYLSRAAMEHDLAKREQVASYTRNDYWSRDYWENIHNLIYLLKLSLNSSDGVMDDRAAFLSMRSASLVGIAVLRMCSDILASGISETKRAVEIFLYGGPQARRRQERLADEVRKASPRSRTIPRVLNPPFTDELTELVAYLLLSPIDASLTPLVFQAAERTLIAPGEIEQLVPVGDIAKKLMKDILQFTLAAAGVSKPQDALPSVFSI